MNITTQKVLLDEHERIGERRLELSGILEGKDDRLATIIGPCSMQLGTDHVYEARSLTRSLISTTDSGIVPVVRLPVWKPRTNDEDWHGLDESEPDAAMYQLAHSVRQGTPVAIEVGNAEHVRTYGSLLTAMWIGARTHDRPKKEIQKLIAACGVIAADIPLLVKNDMNGGSVRALKLIEKIREVRSYSTDVPAPVAMIFRGGASITTESEWEEAVLQSSQAAKGSLIVDTAHGSETVHDHNAKKSVEGQIRALKHLRGMVSDGLALSGVMVEASDVVVTLPERETDPNIPTNVAKRLIREIEKERTENNRKQ